MLLWSRSMSELDFEQLMQVYWEGNRENALTFYADMEPEKGHIRAEQDFWSYLIEDFFAHKGSCYAILEHEGKYVSALRLEPWEDGLLLEALETHPDYRRRGYARKLIEAVQSTLPEKTVYSHVNKRNTASLAVHKACGFKILKESARLLDGTVSTRSFTLGWRLPMDRT